jgi:Protein of unknown function (DUF1257)
VVIPLKLGHAYNNPMSHFTTIKVQIKNGEILRETLQDLGFTVEQQTMVRGYMGNKIQADYVIRQDHGYDLGFRKQGDHYELVADFWGAAIDPTDFTNLVSQKYAHKSLIATVQSQGFAIAHQETLEDGTLSVLVERWV